MIDAYDIVWIEGLPEIVTERMRLRMMREDEDPRLHRYVLRNRAHFRPWEPRRDDAFFQPERWRGVGECERAMARDGEGYRFRLILSGEAEFVGHVAIKDVARGPMQSASIGYGLDERYVCKGLMSEALLAVVRFAFEGLNLRRLEACCMAVNLGSVGVLQRTGFEREGLLRSSLYIDGQWEDHLIWSRINEAWQEK